MEAKFLLQNKKLHTIMYCKLWANMPVHLKNEQIQQIMITVAYSCT